MAEPVATTTAPPVALSLEEYTRLVQLAHQANLVPQPVAPAVAPAPAAQLYRPPTPTPNGPLYLLILILGGAVGWLLWHGHGQPEPTPSPIPSPAAVDVAAKAYRIDQPRAFRSVAADLRAGTIVPDKAKDALKTALGSSAKALADAIDAAPDKAAAYERVAVALEAR